MSAWRWWQEFRDAHTLAAPASTLLGLTVGLLLLGLGRLCLATPAPEVHGEWFHVISPHRDTEVEYAVWLPERSGPGQTFGVYVDPLDPLGSVAAWLPGLDPERVPLETELETGYLRGSLRLPGSAPRTGWFTVRLSIVDRSGATFEHDFRVRLGPAGDGRT